VAFSCAMPVFVGVSLALGTLTLSDLRALRQLPGKCRSDPA
jgi:hypothetical protein